MPVSDTPLACKIVDVSLHSPPQVTPKGFRVLAGFTLLRRPLRIRDCSLVRAPTGTLHIWTPDPAVRISRAGNPELVEAVQEAVEAAKARLD